MSRAVLSAGSNLGDPVAHLQSVVDGFADHLVSLSRVYSTPPWGGIEQADFRNITLIVEGPLAPAGWLTIGHRLENDADRTREVRWGPRTLDVDVISVTDGEGREIVDADPHLTLPHPRAAQRAFVLVPWLEIDPDARLWTPGGSMAVSELVRALAPDEVAAVEVSDEQVRR